MRFYFDFVDGDRTIPDVEGHDVEDLAAVRAELLRALPEVLLSEPGAGDERRVACSVRDRRGAVVCRATVTLAVQVAPEA